VSECPKIENPNLPSARIAENLCTEYREKYQAESGNCPRQRKDRKGLMVDTSAASAHANCLEKEQDKNFISLNKE